MTTTEILDLIQLLDNPDWQVRNSIAQTIVNQDQKIVPVLIKTLPTTTGLVRDEIIHILGELEDERAIGSLTSMLNDTDKLIINRVVMALLKFQNETVIELLLSKLNDLPPNTAMHVIKHLGTRRYQPAVAFLIDLMTTTVSHNYRFMAIRALDALDATEALDIIAQFVDDPDYYVRTSAQQALEHFNQLSQQQT